MNVKGGEGNVNRDREREIARKRENEIDKERENSAVDSRHYVCLVYSVTSE